MDIAEELLAEETARYSIINETINVGTSPVQQFYSGAVVLVTGGSGFLGKQLIEKLLRSAKIKKIYIILRPKKTKTIEDRMKSIFDDQAYEYLNKNQPNFKEKVIPVAGDVSEINLGISDQYRELITEEVSIIFHGAATVGFTEPLRVAAQTNVLGTREVIKLAKDCKNLKSFVYISTAYSHATYERINQPVLEKFYDSPMSPEALLQIVDSLDDGRLDAITPELIKNWPNTYTFTKAIAEETVRIYAAELPACIVRPAIVIGAEREPEPGWLDFNCVFGASGIPTGYCTGVLHALYADKDNKMNFVPVDIVNNAAIVAAHKTAVRWVTGDTETKIYAVTNTRDPLTMGEAIAYGEEFCKIFSPPSAIGLRFVFYLKTKLSYFLMSWLLHFIPAYIVDGILRIFRKKPVLTKMYKKIDKLTLVLKYFTTNEWIMDDSNLQRLSNTLSAADRIIYKCDMVPMDWRQQFFRWGLGCRKYILKDGLKNTSKGLNNQVWFTLLSFIILPLYIYILYTILYSSACIISNLIYLCLCYIPIYCN